MCYESFLPTIVPVPTDAIERVAGLRSKAALLVLIALYAEVMRWRARRVAISPDLRSRFAITRKTLRRGLQELEAVGLIEVHPKDGHSTSATVLCLSEAAHGVEPLPVGLNESVRSHTPAAAALRQSTADPIRW